MGSRRFAAGLLFAALLLPLHAVAQDALAALDECIPKLDKRLDVGYERVAARCPGLADALERSGWAAWLPAGWKESRNDLSAGSLAELRAVVARELSTQPPASVPSVDRLNEILTHLGATAQQRSSLWARIKKWVRSLLERRAQSEDGWLNRMISRVGLPQTVIELITWIAMGAVIVLAGLIVLNELRAAGWVRVRRIRQTSHTPLEPSSSLRPTWADVERAGFAEKPRVLLNVISAKLMDLGKLPPAGAFTVREIVRAADLREPAQKEHLRELALAAERARFAQGGVSPATADAAVVHARELLTALESSDARSAASGARA